MSKPPAAATPIAELIKAGMEHHRAGRLAEAEPYYREALRRDSVHAEALHLLGILAGQANRLDEALDLLRRAADRAPRNPDYLNSLGKILARRERHGDAVAAFRRALQLDPNLLEAYANAAEALQSEARRVDKLGHGKQARELRQFAAAALAELGVRHLSQGVFTKAETALRDAAAIDPRSAAALTGLGMVLGRTGRLGEAERVLRRAIAIDPRLGEAYRALGHALYERGAHEAGLAAFNKARALKANPLDPDPELDHAALFNSLYRPDLSPQKVFAAHRDWGLAYAAARRAEGKTAAPFANSREPERVLKVAYLSPDFRKHSVSYFLEPLLASHDPRQVDFYCYANVLVADHVTRRFQELSPNWRPIAGLDDAAVQRQLRADQIDIVVELAGHTPGSRLTALVPKPAPVIVNWLGYAATTGLPGVDYRITDAVADPPGESDRLHTEALVRLPEGFLCYRAEREAPPVAPLPAEKEGVTLGSFNNPAKITAGAVALWSRILLAVPGSRILLKGTQFADPEYCQRMRDLFAKSGIAATRVDLRGRALAPAEHLGMYGEVDIGLDTFPYNGTTTTCEAFWMGVPVVALRGDRHAARVGASLLTQIGLPALVAESEDEYVAKTAALAGDLKRLGELRAGLRARLQASPLGDEAGFARGFEAALRTLWRQWCGASSPPA